MENYKIPVAEIFGPTIQGEGPNVGIKTLFLRVVGCDFKCEWCDSKFAWKLNAETQRLDVQELAYQLIKKCIECNTGHVILTGGNPCLYDFSKVIELLNDHGISVDVETQGSILPEWLQKVETVVISPKAPSSKQPDVMENVKDWLHRINHLDYKPKVVIKIPVFNEEDFQFAESYYKMVEDIIWETDLDIKMYLSVGNTNTNEAGSISDRILLDYEKLIERTMKSEMKKVYVLPQVHTLVWGNKQGV